MTRYRQSARIGAICFSIYFNLPDRYKFSMFGLFNLPKLLLLVAIIFAVWYGFKWLNNRQAQVPKSRKPGSFRATSRPAADPEEGDIEEMIPCPDCGAYVAKGGKHKCG